MLRRQETEERYDALAAEMAKLETLLMHSDLLESDGTCFLACRTKCGYIPVYSTLQQTRRPCRDHPQQIKGVENVSRAFNPCHPQSLPRERPPLF